MFGGLLYTPWAICHTPTMNIPTTCPRCQHAFQTEYLDSGIHELTCPACQGRFALFIRKHRFETLFDLGTRALLDGYAREAVVNFAAALERCLEFYLRSALLERFAAQGHTLEDAAGELEATWKLLVNQSERQLGAFAAVYLSRQGRAPDFLTPQGLGAEFRNRVIHRGYLPREQEVQDYAAGLFALMNRLLEDLGDAALQATLTQEREYAAALARLDEGVPAVFEEHPGMFRTPRIVSERSGSDGSKSEQDTRSPAPVPVSHQLPAPALPNARPLNDAAAFQAALRERGTLVSELFRGKAGR